MQATGLKKALSLIGRTIGNGKRGAMLRAGRAGAHLVASTTSGGSQGSLHHRAGKTISKVASRISPQQGVHVRRFAPVVLLAAALAESAHAPLLKGANAMSWKTPPTPRVGTNPDRPDSVTKKKPDVHLPPGTTDAGKKPVAPDPNLLLWDQALLNPTPAPFDPISLIHVHGGDNIDPNNGGGGSDPIVHGAVYNDGGGAADGGGTGGGGGGTTGGGGADAGGGGGTAGGGSQPTPTVVTPTQVTAVPEPTALIWLPAAAMLLRRRRR